MPELYDFMFELAYKALIFEENGETRLYVDRLEEFIKKIFTFIFKEDPNSLDKFIFIIDWAKKKQTYKTSTMPNAYF